MTKFIDSGAAKLRIEEAATKKQVSCGFRLRSMSGCLGSCPTGARYLTFERDGARVQGQRCSLKDKMHAGPEKRNP